MARRSGRNRKLGNREPNGRIQRVETGPDRGPLERQAQMLRMIDDVGQVDLDDALSVLASLGHITNEQAAAGTDYGQAHRALYGQPWAKTGERVQGRSLDGNDGSALEKKVARGLSAISTQGGNAFTICRTVCIARIVPGWVIERPVVTPIWHEGKWKIRGARDRDRQKLRAMKRELPALKKGLDALVRAHFGGKRMEMAA